MKVSRNTVLHRVVVAGFLSAIVLSLVFSFLLFDQTSTRFTREAEFHAFRVMTGVLDRYTFDPQFDPSQLEDVRGFGVYAPGGQALFQWGSAPGMLDGSSLVESSSLVSLQDRSVIIIRKTGTMPRRRHMMGEPSPDRPHMPGRGMRMERYVFAEVGMEAFFYARRIRFVTLATLLLIFIASLSLALVYSRRIAKYRTREAENAHLVQLGEAARTLAHEIKNPLGVIRVQCATLAKTIPETYKRNVSVIEEETARLSALTDRLRDFLQNSEGRAQLVTANAIIEQCALRYAGKISVVNRASGDVRIWIDPDRLMQVLDNLLANALESHSTEMPLLSLETRQGHAVCTVSDRGSGIAPEHRTSLFTPFFTTKPKGSGIGLALSRRFITLAGGSLEWAERPGGGSLFIASIPLDKGQSKREVEHGG